MAAAIPFTIGVGASCTDGVCGEVSRVVVDPVAQTLTHLVVEPKHQQGPGRLVPLDIVDSATGEIRLRCTMAEFNKLSRAEKTEVLPGTGDYAGYGPDRVLDVPYNVPTIQGEDWKSGRPPHTVSYDAIPSGEVAVRRGDPVHATDGEIGRVQGLVVDSASRHVTHVLLQEGHLWGSKEVAIPIGAVARLDAGIQLKLTKRQVKGLPPVDLDHPPG